MESFDLEKNLFEFLIFLSFFIHFHWIFSVSSGKRRKSFSLAGEKPTPKVCLSLFHSLFSLTTRNSIVFPISIFIPFSSFPFSQMEYEEAANLTRRRRKTGRKYEGKLPKCTKMRWKIKGVLPKLIF